MTLGEETLMSLLRSPGTELFGSIELYLGDGLVMAGCLAVILGRDSAHC